MRDGGNVIYRPTCHYAYHPANDAVLSLHEMFGATGRMQPKWHILDENEIEDGIEAPTAELHAMCLDLVAEAVESERLMTLLDIPEASRNPLMLQGDHTSIEYRNIVLRPVVK